MKVTILLILLTSSVFAATTISGGAMDNVTDAFASWMQGSLGLIIALLGTLGSLIWFLIGEGVMGGSKKALFVGILVSFFAGGMVSIAITMMNLGRNAFN